MRRVLPLLAVAVLLGGALFVLFGGKGEEAARRDFERAEEEAQVPPHLRGIPSRLREAYARKEAARQARTEAARAKAAKPPERDGIARRGRVLTAESGQPIAGAHVFFEHHLDGLPCPRLPSPELEALWDLRGMQDVILHTLTNAEGRFEIESTDASPLDVFVKAPGRVLGVVCDVQAADEGEVVIRLEKGLTLSGHATWPTQVPVESASVRVRPGPETPALPGHGGVSAITGEEGSFTLDGLLPGEVFVDADHPLAMPATWGPLDPAVRKTLDLVLQPALRATFAIRTDDGREVKNATLTWERVQGARAPQALLLPMPAVAPGTPLSGVGEAIEAGPIRLPATEGALLLTIRADGYGAWTHGPFRPREEGGEETFEVLLKGDLTTGWVRIALEDDDGEALHAGQAGVRVGIMPLEDDAAPATYVVLPQQELKITALPAGRYRIRLTAAAFAPLEAEIVVTAGQETATTLRTSPPAKLRVRFFAPRTMLVHFHLVQEGREVVAIPEDAAGTEAGPLAAGEDGLVLTGLGAGTYQIEVLSDEVTAPSTTVHLAEGDIQEVEIHVSDR